MKLFRVVCKKHHDFKEAKGGGVNRARYHVVQVAGGARRGLNIFRMTSFMIKGGGSKRRGGRGKSLFLSICFCISVCLSNTLRNFSFDA